MALQGLSWLRMCLGMVSSLLNNVSSSSLTPSLRDSPAQPDLICLSGGGPSHGFFSRSVVQIANFSRKTHNPTYILLGKTTYPQLLAWGLQLPGSELMTKPQTSQPTKSPKHLLSSARKTADTSTQDCWWCLALFLPGKCMQCGLLLSVWVL